MGRNKSANIKEIMRSVLKERGQHRIREKIKIRLLTHKLIMPKVTKAPFIIGKNG